MGIKGMLGRQSTDEEKTVVSQTEHSNFYHEVKRKIHGRLVEEANLAALDTLDPSEIKAEIEKNFDKPVYWLAPNDFSEIVSSINRGVPLVKLSPNSPFSKNMVEFRKKFLGILDDTNFRGIKGTFGKSI